MPKETEIDIIVKGQADASVAQALGMTVEQINRVKQATQSMGSIGIPSKSLQSIENFRNKFSELGDFITKVGIGTLIATSVQQDVDLAIKSIQTLGQALAEASRQAASLESQRQLYGQTMQLSDAQVRAEVSYLRSIGKDAPYATPAELMSEKVLSESYYGTHPQGKHDYARRKFLMASDLAAFGHRPGGSFDEELEHISNAISGLEMQGYVTKQALTPLEESGINVRAVMLDQQGMLNGMSRADFAKLPEEEQDKYLQELPKRIKGRKEMSAALDKALAEITGEGGIAYGAAAKMSNTTEGRENTLKDNVMSVQQMAGDVVNKSLSPLLDKINTEFANELPKIEKFFEDLGKSVSPEMTAAADHLFHAMETLFKDIPWNTVASGIEAAAKATEHFASMVDNVTGFIHGLAPNPNNVSNSGKKGQQVDWNDLLNVPMTAQGGIVDQATLLVAGEAGSEAITPITDFREAVSALNDIADHLEQMTTNIGTGAGGFGLSSGYAGGDAYGDDGMSGGVKLTSYGYAGDATPDWNSLHGIGDRDNHLQAGLSVALTKSMRERLFGTRGGSTGKTFQYGGRTYRDDDTAPESDLRIDRYNPGHAPDVHVHMHVHAMDTAGVDRVLQDHGHRIAETVHEHLRDSWAQSAVV